ncbi:MAG TPA: OsmC family protein [Methylomirabilota bacterium]|nr:OsmC family protein [Methylomirabilota bacterium]
MALGLNDVDVDGMKELDRKVRENPALGKRTAKLRCTWQRGVKALVEIGAQEVLGKAATPPTRRFFVAMDGPAGLGGVDAAATAAETLLAALAGCITSGIAANAALFNVPIEALSVDVEGDIDFRGLLGHDKSVRNGFTDIRYTVTIQSPASEEQVRRCKETIDRKSPVADSLANPVKITSTFVHKRS